MDFQAVVDRLVTHATNAGRSLPNRITDVAFAHPVPAGSRSVRLYYDGEATPEGKVGAENVLTGELIAERIVLVAFWTLTTDGVLSTATVEAELRAFKHAYRTNVLGDSQLNGGVGDLYLDYAETGFATFNGTMYRWVEMGATVDWEEYTISV